MISSEMVRVRSGALVFSGRWKLRRIARFRGWRKAPDVLEQLGSRFGQSLQKIGARSISRQSRLQLLLVCLQSPAIQDASLLETAFACEIDADIERRAAAAHTGRRKGGTLSAQQPAVVDRLSRSLEA